MPRSRSDDRSSGDAREPYADRGGPAGRHAETHDVRREQLTNPKGPDRSEDDFAADLAPDDTPDGRAGHADRSRSAADDKRLPGRLQTLDPQELARLTVLKLGTRLEQGSVYLDLDDLERGPFKALAGQEATRGNRYVSKRDTDYELWNRLAGHREAEVERPT